VRLRLRFTAAFAELYDRLPEPDLEKVNAALDELEERHDQPEMRNTIHVGSAVLFATTTIYPAGSVYRITWCYDDRDHPTAVVCITVASIEA